MRGFAADAAHGKNVKLGIRANLAQYTLPVVVNGFVGAMVGMERTILPADILMSMGARPC